MPWFGIGVFKVERGPELVNAVKTAIEHGFKIGFRFGWN